MEEIVDISSLEYSRKVAVVKFTAIPTSLSADEQKVAFTRPETTHREVGIAVNCTTATFREYSREEISTISSVVKARVQGPVDISGTLSVLCELEVY